MTATAVAFPAGISLMALGGVLIGIGCVIKACQAYRARQQAEPLQMPATTADNSDVERLASDTPLIARRDSSSSVDSSVNMPSTSAMLAPRRPSFSEQDSSNPYIHFSSEQLSDEAKAKLADIRVAQEQGSAIDLTGAAVVESNKLLCAAANKALWRLSPSTRSDIHLLLSRHETLLAAQGNHGLSAQYLAILAQTKDAMLEGGHVVKTNYLPSDEEKYLFYDPTKVRVRTIVGGVKHESESHEDSEIIGIVRKMLSAKLDLLNLNCMDHQAQLFIFLWRLRASVVNFTSKEKKDVFALLELFDKKITKAPQQSDNRYQRWFNDAKLALTQTKKVYVDSRLNKEHLQMSPTSEDAALQADKALVRKDPYDGQIYAACDLEDVLDIAQSAAQMDCQHIYFNYAAHQAQLSEFLPRLQEEHANMDLGQRKVAAKFLQSLGDKSFHAPVHASQDFTTWHQSFRQTLSETGRLFGVNTNKAPKARGITSLFSLFGR